MNALPTDIGSRRSYRLSAIAFVPALVLLVCWALLSRGSREADRRSDGGRGSNTGYQARSSRDQYIVGTVEFETRSAFSHVRVRKHGDVRAMLFVRDLGEEVVETMVDLDNPHHLLVRYTQYMFASYLFKSEQRRVLIVGLGGGAMVHFLQHHDPKLQVDAVEIDPAVVKIADEYFRTRSGENVKIITADGFDYLGKTENRYDVIYMDAFLKPSAETDGTGMPLRMKTIRFLQGIQEKLQPQGMVVINLNLHQTTRNDLSTIRNAFPQTYVFRVPPRGGNLVVVGSLGEAREKTSTLRTRAAELDRRFGANFSFQEIMKNMAR